MSANEGFLPYGRHNIDEDDIAEVVALLRSGPLTQGPKTQQFEGLLAQTVGAAACVAVSSGTAALHLAYQALGLGPGDELITSPITFVATANAARQLGAKVIFADVDALGNLDPESVRARITERTRGIAAVHFSGTPCDMASLGAIAREHGLFLVEDAAHALGATYQGKTIGGCVWSDLVTFSFHPVKHITTAEGGAIALRSSEYESPLRRSREHGLRREAAPDSRGLYGYVQEELGYNYRLSDLNAALGVSQLRKLAGFLEARRAVDRLYRDALSDLDPELLAPLPEKADRESAHHLFPVQIDFAAAKTSRGAVMERLRARGIGSQVHYIPVHTQPYYRGQHSCPNAERFFAKELSLPMYPGLTSSDVGRVVDTLRDILLSDRLSRSA